MTSLTKKPSTLPLSLSTSTNPNMPTFYDSGRDIVKVAKKKKPFAPFDKIRNVFGRSHKLSESDEITRSAIKVPLIVTPTEEPYRKIINLKTMSHSAENVFNSGREELKGIHLMTTTTTSQRSSSSECLKPKEINTKLLRSTECLLTKTNKVVSALDPMSCDPVEEEVPDNKFQADQSHAGILKSEGVVQHDDDESPSEKMCEVNLNEVCRSQTGLDHKAALHRKDLKPKGRRPPTIYKQSSYDAIKTDRRALSFITEKYLSFEINDNLTASLECPKVVNKTDEPSPPQNIKSPLQPLKRNKAFPCQLEEIQKLRRKTISNFQMLEDQKHVEVPKDENVPELKVSPAKPQRNASFKVIKEENKPVAMVSLQTPPSEQKPSAIKTLSLQKNTEKMPILREKSTEVDASSRKSHFIRKTIDLSLKESSPVTSSGSVEHSKVVVSHKPDEKDSSINKRPQSRFTMQSSTPVNLTSNLKSFKSSHDEELKNRNDLEEVKGEVIGDSMHLGKSEKLPLKSSDASISQPEKMVEPSFKKFLRSPATFETSNCDSLTANKIEIIANKIPPIKPEKSSKPDEQNDGTAETFESARQKFGSRAIKIPQHKTIEESTINAKSNQSQLHPSRFVSVYQAPKIHLEEKSSSPKADDLTSNAQSNIVVGGHAVKKNESFKPSLQAKHIPPEPFKTIAPETGKNNVDDEGVAMKFGPGIKNRMSIKERLPVKGEDISEQGSLRSSSVKLSTEIALSPSRNVDFRGKETEESKQDALHKPATRAAIGVNAKIIPNKLNLKSDDWMAKRREKLENLS